MQPGASTNATPAVTIIVISYNTRVLTLAALDSIYAETDHTAFEVIVVDNASSDGSAEALANHPAKPRLIALQENIGFARANNLAAEHATSQRILLLNPDTVVVDHAIDRLMSFADLNPSAKIWGGRTLFPDGTLNPSSCWHRITAWNLLCRATGLAAIFPASAMFNTEAYGGWQRDTVRCVDIVSGCFLLIDRDLWTDLNGFDRHFFMYGEDADLCLRAHHFGATPMITPSATIIHYGGASERIRAEKMMRLLRAKASLISTHWSPVMAPLGRALLAAWPLSRWIATSLHAGLTSSPAARDAATTWATIWRGRATWYAGYDNTIATEQKRHRQPNEASA